MKCVYCEKDSDQIPVIPFEYKGQSYGICISHLPVLLHKPEQFADKLPETEGWQKTEHNH